MKIKNRISNCLHTLAFFAALRENFSSKSLRLCVKIFGILLFAPVFASCPHELSRFPVLPGEIRISPSAEVTVNTQVTIEYIPKYSEQVDYCWSQDGAEIPGETGASFTPGLPGQYTVTLSAHFYESVDWVITAMPALDSFAGEVPRDIQIIHTSDASVGEELVAEYAGSEGASFQWYKDGEPIPGATDAAYTPSEPGSYTVTVSVPGQEPRTSEPVTVNPAFVKAAGAAVSQPTLESKTHNRITLATIAPSTGQAVQYSMSDTNNAAGVTWQDCRAFASLEPGKTYYFFAQALSNANYEDGPISESAAIATMQQAGLTLNYWVNEQDEISLGSGAPDKEVTIAVGETLTISPSGSGYSGYRWLVNGEETGETGASYTFDSVEAEAGKTYTVTLIVERSGKYYSAEFVVLVVSE